MYGTNINGYHYREEVSDSQEKGNTVYEYYRLEDKMDRIDLEMMGRVQTGRKGFEVLIEKLITLDLHVVVLSPSP